MDNFKDPFVDIYEDETMETIDHGPSEIIEEFIDFPEEEILNQASHGLIRLDMNIIEYPLFSKNRRRKKNQTVIYYFNGRKDKYIEVKPISGSTIPGEFEEKVFIALVKIMRKNNYGREFAVTTGELLENMNITNNKTKLAIRNEIKNSLIKLSESSYTFKNSMYSNTINGIIEQAIITSIMSIRIITRKTKECNAYDQFRDGRIKEIYLVSLSDYFYNNIIKKGYLVYDSNILLELETPTARSIYMMITKWRFNKLYLKQSILTILKRIPLKSDKSHIGRSVKTIINGCEELKKKKLIVDFNILKPTTWEESEIEFHFDESHNLIKQNNFFEDRNCFSDIMISDTVETDERKEAITDEDLYEIWTLLPEKAKKLKSMPKTILEQYEKYGAEKLKKAAIYVRDKNVTSIRSYFLKTLENNWAEDIEIPDKILEKKLTFIEEKKIDLDNKINISQEEHEEVIKKYKEFPISEQQTIEKATYQAYIESCGMEGKAQKIAFNAGKEALIRDFLIKNNYFEMRKESYEKQRSQYKNIDTDIEIVKEYIEDLVNNYAALLGMDCWMADNLKKRIVLKVVKLFMKETLTLEVIDKIADAEVLQCK